MTTKYWDLFLSGRWIGMASGLTFIEATEMTKKSLPAYYRRIKYRRWYGRLHEKNCHTSGGMISDPT